MNTCIIIYDTESMILQAINTHQYKQVLLYQLRDIFFYTNIYIITHKHEYNI